MVDVLMKSHQMMYYIANNNIEESSVGGMGIKVNYRRIEDA